MSRYSDQIRDEYGRPVPGVLIYVYVWDESAQTAGELDSLTADDSTALLNPLTSDVDGLFYFNAVDGQKLLEFHYAGSTRETKLIALGVLRGRSVLSGPVDPDGSIGDNGDFYINTTTSTIFGPRTSGAWGSGTSLRGANGALTTSATTRFGRATDPVAGDGPISPLTLIFHDPVPVTGTIATAKAYGGTYAGTMTLRRFTKSGTVFTQVGSDSAALTLSTSTLNTSTPAFNVNQGEYLGMWLDAAGAGPLAYTNAASDNGGFYFHSGNQTSLDTGTSSFSNVLRLEVAFDIDYEIDSGITGEVAALRGSVASAIGDVLPDECEIILGGWTCVPAFGESISTGHAARLALSLTQPYFNLTFTGGVKSTGGADIAGTTAMIEDNKSEDAVAGTVCGESPVSSASNHAVRLAARERGIAPSQFVIFGFTGGHGGAKVADISTGTTYYDRFIDQITAAKDRANDTGVRIVLPAIHLLIGINDAFAGTAYATVLAQLIQLQSDLETDIQTITGQTTPVHFLVSQQSQYNSTGTGTTKALAAACRASRLIHMAAPQYIFQRQEGTHPTNISAIRIGHYQGRAFEAIARGLPTPALWPVSASADGTALEICFSVPVGPIVLDTSAIGAATDYGIKVVDDTGTLTLSSIVVSSDGEVITATLNRTLGANPKCRIGLDYGVAGTYAADFGTATNIRDSSTDTHVTQSTTYHMYNWAVADELLIAKLAEAA